MTTAGRRLHRLTTPQNIGWCTGQCWYDNYLVSPPEDPDVVYLGGSYSYGQEHGLSNGRAVLLSTNGGATWSDMTLDKDGSGWLHPDEHALVTVPGEPLQWIAGNDGGVLRSNGKYVDASSDCDERGLNAADTAFCKSLLWRWRIPDETTHSATRVRSRDPAVPEASCSSEVSLFLGQPPEAMYTCILRQGTHGNVALL